VEADVFEVAAKADSAWLPAAAPLKARKVRRDSVLRDGVLRDADMLSPQGGWRWQAIVFSRLVFRGSKIALSESSRTIENSALPCQILPAYFFDNIHYVFDAGNTS
jgi:hypothetical protein